MTYKDVLKLGFVLGATTYAVETSFRVLGIVGRKIYEKNIEKRFVDDEEFRYHLYDENPVLFWKLKRKHPELN